MAEPRARIVIRDLAKTFREGGREVAAVQDVSVEVRAAEFVAIVGPSGCGSRPSAIAARFVYLASGHVGLTIWQMALSMVQSTQWGFVVGVSKQLEMRLLRWRPEYRDRA